MSARWGERGCHDGSYACSVRAVTGSLQDYVPLMRYLPANARSKAAASYGARRKVFMSRLFDELQERIGSGTDESCISGLMRA